MSAALGQHPQNSHCSHSFSAEHAIAVGGCHRPWLSHFHTLFTAHYYLSITCNYPSWWLMECFRGWVGKQLGLSCWGLYIITQSLNRAQCEDNLRGATSQWLACCVPTSGLLSSCNVAFKKVTRVQMLLEQWLLLHWDGFLWSLEKSLTLIFSFRIGLFYKLSWWWWQCEDARYNCHVRLGLDFHLNDVGWWWL